MRGKGCYAIVFVLFNFTRQDNESLTVLSMATLKESTFFEFMDGVIVRLGQLRRVGTVKNYRAAMGSFSRFRKGEDIALRSVDRIVVEDYQTYLKSAGLAPNSISFYMRILRAVYRRAVAGVDG